MTTMCTGPKCDRPSEGRGLCHAHAEQRRRRSNGLLTPLRPTDAKARFALMVIKNPDGCWVWQGATDGRHRYGSFQFEGRVARAHRVSFEWAKGPIPEGLVLDHLCRTTLCVNPDHLEAVTQYANVLRGDGWGGVNSRKTHCPQGHPYDESNTYVQPSTGGRVCRTCDRARKRTSAKEVAA